MPRAFLVKKPVVATAKRNWSELPDEQRAEIYVPSTGGEGLGEAPGFWGIHREMGLEGIQRLGGGPERLRNLGALRCSLDPEVSGGVSGVRGGPQGFGGSTWFGGTPVCGRSEGFRGTREFWGCRSFRDPDVGGIPGFGVTSSPSRGVP